MSNVVGVAFFLGLAYWFIIVAEEGRGSPLLPAAIGFPLLVITPLILGFLSPRTRSGLIGVSFVFGPLVIAWWTAPRGDGDGLWLLWFPYLVIWGLVSWGLAQLGVWIRSRPPFAG